MKIELNKYRIQFEPFRQILEKRGTENIDKTITELSGATHTPLIVLGYYAREIIAPEVNQQLEEFIERIRKWYGYTTIE